MPKPAIIMFNGPKRAGKDTGADFVLDYFATSSRYKFTHPMDLAFQAMFNIDPVRWAEIREKLKDEPVPEFRGKTFRELIIPLSEEWAKPLLGADVFGWLGAEKFLPDDPIIVTSDSGFEAEAMPFVNKVGPDRVLLFRVHRDGCEWDSRGYVYLENYGVKCVDVDNNGTLHDYRNIVLDVTYAWLKSLYVTH